MTVQDLNESQPRDWKPAPRPEARLAGALNRPYRGRNVRSGAR